MKTIKMILISLAVLLGLFMLVGIYYGALLFFFVLKLIGAAILIAYGIFLFSGSKDKNKTNE
jgi:uncharacterized membrane protein